RVRFSDHARRGTTVSCRIRGPPRTLMSLAYAQISPDIATMHSPLPKELISAVQDGTCIAFVGAGFSRPGGVLLWRELLLDIARRLDPDRAPRRFVETVLAPANPPPSALDQAAQVLEDALESAFRGVLVDRVRAADPNHPEMRARIEALKGIPFRA